MSILIINGQGILGMLFLKKVSPNLARTQTWTSTGVPRWGIGFDFRWTGSVMMTVLVVVVGNFYFWSRLEV